MSEEKGYNGWSNYETWNVALWIGNVLRIQCKRFKIDSNSMAQSAWDEAEADRSFTRAERATLDLADSLKEWIESDNPLAGDASMFSDLLGAALSEVDYHEIAEHYIEDVDKETEEETEEEEV